MSCDVGVNINLNKCKKKSCLSRFCKTIFGCASKEKSSVKDPVKTFASVAIQCEISNELERTRPFAERTILVESKTKFDITLVDNDVHPRTEEFKNSLRKIDNLIKTLDEIQAVYKNKALKCNELLLNTHNEVDDINIDKSKVQENFLNVYPEMGNLSEEEILNFNINFDENTYIQCHTDRGKHSLKIIQHSDHNFNPFILHRCESELLLTKSTELGCTSQIVNRKSSIELSCQEVTQLQRSYYTLPPRKLSGILNLSSFKSNIIEHMRNIKEDVKTLRNILYNIECLVKREDKPNLPFYLEEIKKWFSERDSDVRHNKRGDGSGGDLVKLEDSRYVEAKIRAMNFCKFYNLNKTKVKLNKDKNKLKKYKKN